MKQSQKPARDSSFSPQKRELSLTKRVLAQLERDAFEVHTKSLRNGVKFYQDATTVVQFGSKHPHLPNSQHNNEALSSHGHQTAALESARSGGKSTGAGSKSPLQTGARKKSHAADQAKINLSRALGEIQSEKKREIKQGNRPPENSEPKQQQPRGRAAALKEQKAAAESGLGPSSNTKPELGNKRLQKQEFKKSNCRSVGKIMSDPPKAGKKAIEPRNQKQTSLDDYQFELQKENGKVETNPTTTTADDLSNGNEGLPAFTCPKGSQSRLDVTEKKPKASGRGRHKQHMKDDDVFLKPEPPKRSSKDRKCRLGFMHAGSDGEILSSQRSQRSTSKRSRETTPAKISAAQQRQALNGVVKGNGVYQTTMSKFIEELKANGSLGKKMKSCKPIPPFTQIQCSGLNKRRRTKDHDGVVKRRDAEEESADVEEVRQIREVYISELKRQRDHQSTWGSSESPSQMSYLADRDVGLSPSSAKKILKAKVIIDDINDRNLKQIRALAKQKNKKPKLASVTLKLQRLNPQKTKINFKLYQDDLLNWPVHSYLIQNSSKIPPKNGESKRIAAEQDYDSDKEIVNSAKQKNKREVKQAILSFLQGKETGKMDDAIYNLETYQ